MQEVTRAIKLWLISKFEVQPSVERDEIEYLRMMLSREQNEKQKLLDYILTPGKPTAEVPLDPSEFKPINRGFTPWHIRKHQLEKEDKERYRVAQRTIEEEMTPKTTEQLEAELLGEQNG